MVKYGNIKSNKIYVKCNFNFDVLLFKIVVNCLMNKVKNILEKKRNNSF